MIEHDTEREDIAARVNRPAGRLLGRHVRERPDDRAHTRVPGCYRARGRLGIRRFHELGQTKVGQLGVAMLRDEDVVRLDVAVNDPGLMSRGEAVGHADEQVNDLPPGTRLRRMPLPECASVNELGDEVLAALVFADVVDRQDVWMVERRRGLRLATEPVPRTGVGRGPQTRI